MAEDLKESLSLIITASFTRSNWIGMLWILSSKQALLFGHNACLVEQHLSKEMADTNPAVKKVWKIWIFP